MSPGSTGVEAVAPVGGESAARPSSAGGADPIRLPGGRWAIWPLACLRSAGFPTAAVLTLSSPASAGLAARLLQARTPEALDALKATFAAERLRIRAALRDLAAEPTFREAIVWPNRRAFRNAVAALASAPIEQVDSEMRKRELLVASYAQRYCLKNDTIGFFGPVGWARFSERALAAEVRCGAGVIAERRVLFESWCIDALARALDGHPELRPWRVPRVSPFVRLEGTHVVRASRVLADLSPDEAHLFAACDGTRHAAAIAADLRSARSSWPHVEAIYDQLEQWARVGYLTWTFEGPRELHPERALRAQLLQVGDAAARERALAELASIEAGRAAVERAAGDAEAVDRALDALESEFSRATGIAATRAHGQMYAARTLVYVDCRRDVSVQLGADLLRRLGPPLSLVLQAARWAVHELARRHACEFRRAFDDLSAGGRRVVTLGSFVGRTSLVGGAPHEPSPLAAGVRQELEQRWATVLGASPAAHHIAYRSRDVRTAVSSAFATSGEPPSAWARHISPDLMIDAPSVEALRRGEYRIVVGEIHVINTLTQSVFMTQCPHHDEVIRWLQRDCPEGRVFWLAPKEAAPQRVQYALKPDDVVYVTSNDPSPVPAARTLRVADLVVVDDGGTLVVRTRDGRLRFPVAEFFGYLMLRKEVNVFSVLSTAPHRPRVTVDDVVICREQWQVRASDVTWAGRGDDVERFVECRRWAYQHGFPQHIFVKIPTERKPTYLDLCSPLFVDLFCRSVRVLQRSDPSALITLTEMMPTPSGAWLVDAAGHHYTSELRIVAVDPSVVGGLRASTAAPH